MTSKVLVVAEVGGNHIGSLNTAERMIHAAQDVGCDFVKFQMRTPELAVPRGEWDKPKETPWGDMSYLDYRRRVEFSFEQYKHLNDVCEKVGIGWFASVWDCPSADRLSAFAPPFIKIPSAKLTDDLLLEYVRDLGFPVILSTGMSTMEEIKEAVAILGDKLAYLLHCTSAYPCAPENLNLACILTLKRMFPGVRIGYSGHEVGLAPSIASVGLGAEMIERHFTLDRASWGTDQAASVEPGGMRRLIKDVRLVERSLGDGAKRVYAEEQENLRKLRGVAV